MSLSPDEPTIVRRFVLAQRSSDSVCAPIQPSVACIRQFHQSRSQTLDPDGRIRVIAIKLSDKHGVETANKDSKALEKSYLLLTKHFTSL